MTIQLEVEIEFGLIAARQCQLPSGGNRRFEGGRNRLLGRYSRIFTSWQLMKDAGFKIVVYTE